MFSITERYSRCSIVIPYPVIDGSKVAEDNEDLEEMDEDEKIR